jgi:putative addiction module component (TIGR02574 family)
MKITIHVEDSHADFLLELFSHLDFVTIEKEDGDISDAEKEFIEQRLAHHDANRDKAVSWDDLKKQITQ